jgi:hypothetical protein
VNLADRRRRQRLPIEILEHLFAGTAELGLEDLTRKLAVHRRGISAQAGQRGLIRRLKLGRHRWS